MNSGADPSRPLPWWLSRLRRHVRVLRLAYIRMVLFGKRCQFGRGVNVGFGAIIQPPDYFVVSDNVSIGRNLFLQSNLHVGEGTLISSNVSFVGNDHDFSEKSRMVFFGDRLPASSVFVEGDSLIGFGVVFVGSVRVGKGAIIGAGSVVTRDIPPYMVCAGVPAKPIRPRFV